MLSMAIGYFLGRVTSRSSRSEHPDRSNSSALAQRHMRICTYQFGGRVYTAPVKRPGLPTMLVRGLFRRCAWCGGRRAFFDGWFGKHASCSTCGLNWRRGDVGYELGAAATAAIICMGPLVVALGGVVAITWPSIDMVPLFVVLGAGGVLLPVLLYPSSYSLWQAVDIVMRPVEPEHFDVSASGRSDVRGGPQAPRRSSR